MKTLTPEEFEALYGQGASATVNTNNKPEARKNVSLFSSEGAVGRAARGVTDFFSLGAVADTFGAEIAKKRTDDPAQKDIISKDQPTVRQTAASGLKGAATFLPGPAVGASIGKLAAYGAGAGYLFDIGQNVEDGKDLPGALVPGAGVPIGAVGGMTGPIAGKGAQMAGKGAQALSDFVTNSPVVKGGLQDAIELGERVPRFISRRNIELRDSATRAERIANSPAPVGEALKSGMDERIINTIEQADKPTRKGYAEIIRLAEEAAATDGTIKMPARPEIVAGEAAAEQYKLIDQQRRKVGKAIGDQVKELKLDNVSVPMENARETMKDALSSAGVEIVEKDGKPTALNFSRTGFTKEQRSKINELYELATEGGDTLTPSQIHAKDRLFSQLQREARMDKIGDVFVEVADAEGNTSKVSLFQVFRDVYSDTLEEIAPEIKPLNKQYRNLSTFVDDIEGSIVKSGKFETNSRVDPSEFAQTNLRRLFSEAGSAADYRAIAQEMDAASRALGYQGAVPADLAQFAFEIRKIYPDSVPRTGFEGSIKSVGDILMGVTKAGKPNEIDQQKALKELIQYYETAPTE